MSLPTSRRAYADTYNLTTGEQVRLGDIALLANYGRECYE